MAGVNAVAADELDSMTKDELEGWKEPSVVATPDSTELLRATIEEFSVLAATLLDVTTRTELNAVGTPG